MIKTFFFQFIIFRYSRLTKNQLRVYEKFADGDIACLIVRLGLKRLGLERICPDRLGLERCRPERLGISA